MPMAELAAKIGALIRDGGAQHWGFANLRPYREEIHQLYGDVWDNYPTAISFGVNFPAAVVEELLAAPTHTYLYYYDVINARVNDIALSLCALLSLEGYRAFPVPASQRQSGDKLAAIFSHRLAARLGGLGWIGKSSSLINPEVGPRLRLGTVLTNAPLPPGEPLPNGCGACRACVKICPSGAICGNDFEEGQPLGERLDAFACDRYLQQQRHSFGKRICGLCIAICPYGRPEEAHL